MMTLKLIVTPLLIILTTLAARRWGPVIGGLIVGLPLTSGPISVFLAVEQGPTFAAESAHHSLPGIIAVMVFCAAYTKISRKYSWPLSAVASYACYFAAVAGIANFPLSFTISTLLVFLSIVAFWFIVGPGTENVSASAALWWDLPFRIITTTAMVVAITTAATHLGPDMSGLISSFPVFISVMTIFSHITHGPEAVRQFSRGVIAGAFPFAFFFITLALTVESLHLLPAYLLATAITMLSSFTVLKLLFRKKIARQM